MADAPFEALLCDSCGGPTECAARPTPAVRRSAVMVRCAECERGRSGPPPLPPELRREALALVDLLDHMRECIPDPVLRREALARAVVVALHGGRMPTEPAECGAVVTDRRGDSFRCTRPPAHAGPCA